MFVWTTRPGPGGPVADTACEPRAVQRGGRLRTAPGTSHLPPWRQKPGVAASVMPPNKSMTFHTGFSYISSGPAGYMAPAGSTGPRPLANPPAAGHYARARKEGARIAMELAEQPWGDRRYEALDLEGHRWYFAEHVRDPRPPKK